MTSEDVKKKLRGYLSTKDELRILRIHLEELREDICGVKAVVLDGMPKGQRRLDTQEAKIARYEDVYNRHYRKQEQDMLDNLVEVEQMIDMVDGWERNVLRLKYISGWTWEDFENNYATGEFEYSRSQVRRIWNRAINNVVKRYE